MTLATDCFATLTIVVLFGAMLVGIYDSGRRRTFWGAVAVAGWGYFALTYGPFEMHEIGQRLLTSKLVLAAQDFAAPLPTYPTSGPMAAYAPPGPAPAFTDFQSVRNDIAVAGHCLCALGAGLVAGLAAARRTRRAASSVPAVPGDRADSPASIRRPAIAARQEAP